MGPGKAIRSDPTPAEPGLKLRRRSPAPAWVSLTWRMALAAGLVGVALAVSWFDRDGLKDNHDGVISFADVVYFTMTTVTTVGYGDIVPVTRQARMFDAFGLTPIRLFIWLIFLGTAYDFVFKRIWEKWRMKVLQGGLHGHLVIAGFGASGEEAFDELVRLGADPAGIVVIDQNTAALERAEAAGAMVLEGDATRNATLEAVQIGRARSIIVTSGRDDTSILIVLTARRLAPDASISVVVRAQDNEILARQAGANTVINPASFAGLLLAGAARGKHMADFIADLATSGGAVALRERPARPEEVGRPLASLAGGVGLRLYRGDVSYGLNDPECRKVETGDVIIEMVETPGGRL